MAYGYGDGGGGPTREMLENIREMGSFPGHAAACARAAVGDFFRQLEAERGRPPADLERRAVPGAAPRHLHHPEPQQARQPQERVPAARRRVPGRAGRAGSTRLYLPGRRPAARPGSWSASTSSTTSSPAAASARCTSSRRQQYAEVQRHGARRARRCGPGGDRPAGWAATLLVANPTSFARARPGLLAGTLPAASACSAPDGTPRGHAAGGRRARWLDAGRAAALQRDRAAARRRRGAAAPRTPALIVTPDPAGERLPARRAQRRRATSRASTTRPTGARCCPPGAIANQFQAFEDRPIELGRLGHRHLLRRQDVAGRAGRVDRGGGGRPAARHARDPPPHPATAHYVQRISLSHNSPRLDFDTTIDWHERHILLKVAFPVDVLSPQATYEIQWGNVQRPTHRNTSWDWARFETCAQKWVDLSEGDYGVSLLNDCKYGHDIQDNVMRLSLLRSPTMPDPEADQGEHRFAYSLLPHAGGWDEAHDRRRPTASTTRCSSLPAASGAPAVRPGGLPVSLLVGGFSPTSSSRRSSRPRTARPDRAPVREPAQARAGHPDARLPARRRLAHQPARREPGAPHRRWFQVRFHIRPYQIVTLRVEWVPPTPCPRPPGRGAEGIGANIRTYPSPALPSRSGKGGSY